MKFFFNGLIATGIFFGVVLVLVFEFFVDFFGISIQPSGEFMAAILGASIGWAGTILTIHASIEARTDDQLNRDRAISTEIFVKFQKMLNNIYHFREHVNSAYAAVNSESHGNPALFLLGLAGHPDPVHFSPEEKALYLRRKRIDAANDVSEWDDIHNSLLRAFEKYSDLRQAFMSSTPAVMNGDVGTTEVSADEYLKIGPWIAQLNHLAEQMKERAVRDFTECRSALMRVKQEMETLCEMKIDLTPLD